MLAAVVTLVLVAAGGRGAGGAPPQLGTDWQGLAGSQRPHVAVGQRMLVVLEAPALADRVGAAGGLATGEQERRWATSALASQKLLISRLGVQGVVVQPEYSYTRVLNGFSAAFDARGLALLERAPEVAGVYPVRAAYPASISAGVLGSSDFAPGSGHRPDIGLSDVDGRGVTVALLDTGVDRAQPFLRGRVTSGIDIVGGDAGALAAPKPDDPSELERHGTQMAGLLVGSGGPFGLSGVAPGASVLPIRVAGWQRDATAQWSVYARTDQVVAGLERAVDPNADGDAHDAARVALVALSQPFDAFADGPLARAAAGALRLDTLVVAPAGNDGPAGPGYGSVSGPGGAPAALTVGAADLRARTREVQVVVRAGLRTELDRLRPLASDIVPREPLDVGVGASRPATTGAPAQARSAPLLDFFDSRGMSLVAGRAALEPAGADPDTTVANAARAGASAVLLYGDELPAGGLGLDERGPIPVVAVPVDVARTLLSELRRGIPLTASIGAPRAAPNGGEDRVAEFSSTGLSFDGRVKPELVAPGVGLETADPGSNPDGSSRFGTVNGTSAAAAMVAGSAALLAQARPALGASELKSLLVGSARPLADGPITAQGAGLVDVGGATASEVAASPTSLAFTRAERPGWSDTKEVVLENVSVRRVRLALDVHVVDEGAAAVQFQVKPKQLFLGAGRTVRIHVRARLAGVPIGSAPTEGALVIVPQAGRAVRVPWAIVFGPRRPAVLSSVRLSVPGRGSHGRAEFAPSDAQPALLSFVAGAVVRSGDSPDVQPLARLDLELWTAQGKERGLLARLRDVLPGRYSFGVTGRDSTGGVLPAGKYWLRLRAYPTDGGPPTLGTVAFAIK